MHTFICESSRRLLGAIYWDVQCRAKQQYIESANVRTVALDTEPCTRLCEGQETAITISCSSRADVASLIIQTNRNNKVAADARDIVGELRTFVAMESKAMQQSFMLALSCISSIRDDIVSTSEAMQISEEALDQMKRQQLEVCATVFSKS